MVGSDPGRRHGDESALAMLLRWRPAGVLVLNAGASAAPRPRSRVGERLALPARSSAPGRPSGERRPPSAHVEGLGGFARAGRTIRRAPRHPRPERALHVPRTRLTVRVAA